MKLPEGSLFYSVRKPGASDAPAPVLLLLHGHGGNETSMASVAEEVPADWMVLSLRAPFELAPGRYRWYTVDNTVTPIRISLGEEALSRAAIQNLIQEVCSNHLIDRNQIFVAGFSQGAIMALSCGLTDPATIAGCAVFSGRFLHEIRSQVKRPPGTLRVFIAHGRADRVLPVQYAKENIAALSELGIAATYSEDDSGHVISPQHKTDFLCWLLQN